MGVSQQWCLRAGAVGRSCISVSSTENTGRNGPMYTEGCCACFGGFLFNPSPMKENKSHVVSPCAGNDDVTEISEDQLIFPASSMLCMTTCTLSFACLFCC